MDVLIFTECPTADYYRALFHLEKQGKVHVQFVDSRCFYLFFLKIYSSSSFLRTFGHRYFGKPLHVEKRVSWSEIWFSFRSYFLLPFTQKKIVALFAPYSPIAIYLYFLKLSGRDIVYMSSWPYWNGRDYVHMPFLFSRFFWKKFLKDMPIVTISLTAKNTLSRYSSHVIQIPHAVDLETFFPGKKKKQFQVLYVGRIIPEKGLGDLLEVARDLPDVSFVFVGSGSFASELRDSGLKNVHFLGEIRDRHRLAELFRESWVFVLNSYKVPHWEELYGIVLLEALASGTPVLSSDCIGPKEIVREDFGFLIPQRNFSLLKEKILFCSQHLYLLEGMWKKGRAFVEEHYDMETLSEKWYEVLLGKAFKS